MSYLYILQHGCLNIIQRFIQNLRPSRLSTRSLQSKIYDPLVSVQGQNEEQRPSRLSTRSLQSKIYDPLISVQGQNEEQRPSRLSTRSK